MQKVIREKAIELLKSGKADRVLGWKEGEFFYDQTPHLFLNPEEVEKTFVYNGFSGANLSKYLVKETLKDGVVAVFLKPCDTYSFSQLLKEHRIAREKVWAVGIPCEGKLDIELLRKMGIRGIKTIEENGEELTVRTIYGDKTVAKKDALAERCANCKSRKHVLYDELLGEEGEVLDSARFDQIEELEQMTGEERFAFWQNELSRCIRCNACRNVCPACTCEKCVFDNADSGIASKAPASSFEEQNFHIIRAFHVVGRCTDCGECSRVCPQGIPLHLINRKFIKDINEFYGTYQAGENPDERAPLTNYNTEDMEPGDAFKKGE
ncbi:MAG: 4Fe-4S dicluster domain-containing protein [Clostridia bacterium]|nr:4Fe-4S dicluster domain-containing protein [Clostridia bacterium]